MVSAQSTAGRAAAHQELKTTCRVSLTLEHQALEQALQALATQCDVPIVAFLPAETFLSLSVDHTPLLDATRLLADQAHLQWEWEQGTLVLGRPLFLPPGLRDHPYVRLPNDFAALAAFWRELPELLKADLREGKSVDCSAVPEAAYRSFADYAKSLMRSGPPEIIEALQSAPQKRYSLRIVFEPELLVYDKSGPIQKGDWVIGCEREIERNPSRPLTVPWERAASWATVPLPPPAPLVERLSKPVTFSQPMTVTLRDLVDSLTAQTGVENYIDRRYADQRVYLRIPVQPAKDLLALVGRAVWLSPRPIEDTVLLGYDVPRVQTEVGKRHEGNLSFLLRELQPLTTVASETPIAILATRELLQGDMPVRELSTQQRAILAQRMSEERMNDKLVQLMPAFSICLLISESGPWCFGFK